MQPGCPLTGSKSHPFYGFPPWLFHRFAPFWKCSFLSCFSSHSVDALKCFTEKIDCIILAQSVASLDIYKLISFQVTFFLPQAISGKEKLFLLVQGNPLPAFWPCPPSLPRDPRPASHPLYGLTLSCCLCNTCSFSSVYKHDQSHVPQELLSDFFPPLNSQFSSEVDTGFQCFKKNFTQGLAYWS